MLDRLPPELLLEILHFSLPPLSTFEAYHQRQRTLHSFTLACNPLYALAQPLLEEIYAVEGDQGDLERLVQAGHGAKVKTLIMYDLADEMGQTERGQAAKELAVIRAFPNVVDLRVSGSEVFLDFLSAFKDLRHLVLFNCDVWHLKRRFIFPSLASLSIRETALYLDPCLLFSSEKTPSLRHLALNQNEYWGEPVCPAFSPDKVDLSRFHTLTVNVTSLPKAFANNAFPSSLSVTLLSNIGSLFIIDDLTASPDLHFHLRLIDPYVIRTDPELATLGVLAFLRNSPHLSKHGPRLLSLRLPRNIDALMRTGIYDDGLQTSVLETCEKSGIQVVWENEDEGDLVSLVPNRRSQSSAEEQH
ncbi:hypothetical protein JCM8547_008066 [Rhodosporidiobolus lusitaniae]